MHRTRPQNLHSSRQRFEVLRGQAEVRRAEKQRFALPCEAEVIERDERRQVDLLLDRVGAIDRGLELAVVHPREGRQTVGWMLREKIAAHEVEHVEQIEALKAGMAEG